jgi:hypothetical protein
MVGMFDIKEKSIDWTGSIRITEDNPDYIVVDTSQLKVKMRVEASLGSSDESHYLGYVQIVTYNYQSNYYGSNVKLRWEFSKTPLSDSYHKEERPWYGIAGDNPLGGYRRQKLTKPTEGQQVFDLQMNMSDSLGPKIAKSAGGSAGQNMLNRIERDQMFRAWLVAVEESKVGTLASYKRLVQFDWRYWYDCSVSLEGAHAQLTVSRDYTSTWAKFGDFMDQIPPEALTAPIANENQQLNYYVGEKFDHVVVARRG